MRRQKINTLISGNITGCLRETFDRAAGILSKKPSYVIVGTGRCGTNYVADYLTEAGHYCGHEKYFTTYGPMFRINQKSFSTRGDSSWLAVPFLPSKGMTVLHQTRDPISVIKSFYDIGFFDERYYTKHKKFVDFAKQHFKFRDDPIQSCICWYIEWNEKCSQITNKHYRIEDFEDRLEAISNWLEFSDIIPLRKISKLTNSRRTIKEDNEKFQSRLLNYPEYKDLVRISNRFGYEL